MPVWVAVAILFPSSIGVAAHWEQIQDGRSDRTVLRFDGIDTLARRVAPDDIKEISALPESSAVGEAIFDTNVQKKREIVAELGSGHTGGADLRDLVIFEKRIAVATADAPLAAFFPNDINRLVGLLDVNQGRERQNIGSRADASISHNCFDRNSAALVVEIEADWLDSSRHPWALLDLHLGNLIIENANLQTCEYSQNRSKSSYVKSEFITWGIPPRWSPSPKLSPRNILVALGIALLISSLVIASIHNLPAIFLLLFLFGLVLFL